jgi:formamidopyrimidine-DNA glycosylase
MPELPEVETTIRDLNKEILARKIQNVWTDFPKMIKLPKSFEQFKKEIIGKKIEKIWRRGKNIIFELRETRPPLTYYLLIHQKLTGHLLIGRWNLEAGNWKPLKEGPLQEKINTYIHLMFWLSGNLMLALSDLRKFAKVELLNSSQLEKELSSLGPEPLEKDFTFEKFKEVLPKKGKIKQVLMDQAVIAGIGNIYSDEILWQAKVHPFRDVSKLKEGELNEIYQAIRKILPKAIELGGESISDFRRPSGKKGNFDSQRKVYQREGEKCSRCQTIIKKIKLAGRSAHYCPGCQK